MANDDNISWESHLTQAKGLADMVSIAGHSVDGQNLLLAGGLMSLANAISDEIDRAIDKVAVELSKARSPGQQH
jgi:hypothetical protein